MKRSVASGLSILLIAAMAVFSLGCANKTARPMEFGMAIPSTGSMTQEKVRNIILQGAASTTWVLAPESDGRIKAVLSHKGYRLEVAILYTAQSYTIQFVNGMDNNGSTNYIKAYNSWIKRLDSRIRKEFLQYARYAN